MREHPRIRLAFVLRGHQLPSSVPDPMRSGSLFPPRGILADSLARIDKLLELPMRTHHGDRLERAAPTPMCAKPAACDRAEDGEKREEDRASRGIGA